MTMTRQGMHPWLIALRRSNRLKIINFVTTDQIPFFPGEACFEVQKQRFGGKVCKSAFIYICEVSLALNELETSLAIRCRRVDGRFLQFVKDYLKAYSNPIAAIIRHQGTRACALKSLPV
jgi:hypothetical protein